MNERLTLKIRNITRPEHFVLFNFSKTCYFFFFFKRKNCKRIFTLFSFFFFVTVFNIMWGFFLCVLISVIWVWLSVFPLLPLCWRVSCFESGSSAVLFSVSSPKLEEWCQNSYWSSQCVLLKVFINKRTPLAFCFLLNWWHLLQMSTFLYITGLLCESPSKTKT